MVREEDTPFKSLSWLGGGASGLWPPSCRELALQSVAVGLGQQTHQRAESPGLEHMTVCALRAWGHSYTLGRPAGQGSGPLAKSGQAPGLFTEQGRPLRCFPGEPRW